MRTHGTSRRTHLKTEAPSAYYAQANILGVDHRLAGGGDNLHWGDQAIGNLGIRDDQQWKSPGARQHGWHKDRWHFRHFLNSFEQGLLTVPFFTDVLPKSGATFFAQDAIRPVAELLLQFPQGLHPDSVQGAGYLIPGLIEQCSEFRELTGSAGDMALIHPFILHRVSTNPTRRPRFIANMAVVLNQPMNFNHDPGDPYSLVELAILYALGVSRLEFANTRPAKPFKPTPFRNAEQLEKERHDLEDEMKTLATAGYVTPFWVERYGYQSNRRLAESTVT